MFFTNKNLLVCQPILSLLLIGMVASVSWAADLGGDLRNAAKKKGQSAKVQTILDKGADVNSTDKSGDTALILAGEAGNIETVKLLLDKGANVNLTNKEDRTALSEAAWSGQLAIMKLLLDKGADLRGYPNVTHSGYIYRRYRALGVTTFGGTVTTIDRPGAPGGRVYGSILFVAVFGCDNELTQALLEKGWPVNAKDGINSTDDKGDTPLLVAVKRYSAPPPNPNEPYGPEIYGFDHPEACLPVVKTLLAKGADVNAKTGAGRSELPGAGRSALDLAVGHPEMIEVLKTLRQ